MSHPSHLCEFFVDNVVTSGHQSKTVAFKFSLERKISKEIKLRINENEWDRKQLHS
jgi:hypothetical protein